MGLAQRLLSWIDPPKEPAPGDWVILTVVHFHEGPMIQSALEGAEIPAVLQEVRAVAGHDAARYRITVRQQDRVEAESILADLRAL